MEAIKEALTFDDVLLLPQFSKVLPSETNISVSLSKNIRLNTPFLSSAMDTVTESQMAIAMAKSGGIGIIHRNLDIKRQCKEVKKVKIISDGGIKFSGDIVKAIAAGADAIMMGSIFAGTDESPGKKFKINNIFYKRYRGMGSIGAMSAGSSGRYFQKSYRDKSKFVPEGVDGRVKYKGNVSKIIYQLKGGLRSSMGYIGANKIEDIKKNAKFIKITKAGFYESMVHSVEMIEPTLNYKL